MSADIQPLVDANGRVIDPPKLRCEARTLKGDQCRRVPEYRLHGYMVCHTHRFGTRKD